MKTDPSAQEILVQKYGGATLATPEHIRQVAERIAKQAKHHQMIAVVSAMGSSTNALLDLAKNVSPHPSRRELDMLLSVGERTSMALISMALNDLGVSAISFTGSQAGILTDEDHFNAKVIDVKADRVREALQKGKVVVLAGFQGVSPQTKEITTLGRGGSDVSAVAMAAALGAVRCEILKEVSAVMSADPKIIPHAYPLRHLSYQELADMCFWGAKVVHHRSVLLAMLKKVPLFIGPAKTESESGTLVDKGNSMGKNQYEKSVPLSLNSHKRVLALSLPMADLQLAWGQLENQRTASDLASPQILFGSVEQGKSLFYVTGPEEVLEAIENHSLENNWIIEDSDLCTVSMTCTGVVSNDLISKALKILSQKKIRPRDFHVESQSLTFVLQMQYSQDALNELHPLLQGGKQ